MYDRETGMTDVHVSRSFLLTADLATLLPGPPISHCCAWFLDINQSKSSRPKQDPTPATRAKVEIQPARTDLLHYLSSILIPPNLRSRNSAQ